MAKISLLLLASIVALGSGEPHGRALFDHHIEITSQGTGINLTSVEEVPRGKRQVIIQYVVPSYPTYQLPRAPVVAASCETFYTRERGVCKPLSECYPVLYTRADESGVRNLTNLDLAEQLMETAGVCQGGEKDNIVCCKLEDEYTTRLIADVKADALRVPDCSTRVVQGAPAAANTFPWMAALMQKGRQFCGGSLIDSRHILTAAHCVSHMTSQHIASFNVYLGTTNLAAVESTRQVYTVTNIWYHRGFSMQTLHHDVAILRLSKEVPKFDKSVQAICLSTGAPAYDTGSEFATLSGWGRTRDGGQQSLQLLMVKLKVWKNSQCKTTYGNKPPAGITDGMVCAGGNGGDACQGDSGGPLVRPSPLNSKRMEQIGIVSWGIGCGTYPGVYTRVDRYRDWIDMVRRK